MKSRYFIGMVLLAVLSLAKVAFGYAYLFGGDPVALSMAETCSSFCGVRGFARSAVDRHAPKDLDMPACICRAPFAPRGIQYDPHDRMPKLAITPTTWSAR